MIQEHDSLAFWKKICKQEDDFLKSTMKIQSWLLDRLSCDAKEEKDATSMARKERS